MASHQVVVRPCASFEDCDRVAQLCGSSFPEECYGQGLSVQTWAQIEAEDLRNRPSWWRQIGMATEGGALLGVVVLTLENEEEDSISWASYAHRVGCGPTILSMLYDRVLDETLLEHECLVDFIAVAPEARGKGVGAKLMAWAERAGAAILAETEAEAVAAHGVDMTLWVAADNATAMRLYQRSGYAVVKRTDQGAACNCVASRVFKWFLGHPVWVKMHKALPAPEHLAACKPEPACIELAATAGEASFVNVPLESGAACQAGQQERPAADKASLGCWPGSRQPRPAAAVAGVAAAAGGDEMVAPAGAHAAVPAATSTSLPSSPRRSFLRKLSGAGAELGPQASQVTPRIAAVGGATAAAAAHQQLDARGQESGRRLTADARAASASAKESDYTVLSLSAAPPAKPLAVTAVPVGSSLASMSVESDSDSEEEEDNPRALHAAQQGAASSADVFQLVELSAGSAALFPPAPA